VRGRGACRHPQLDRHGARGAQHADRLARGAAGRQHVVDQRQVPARQHTRAAWRDAKGSRDIAGACRAAQVALLGGRAATLEQAVGERQPDAARRVAGDDRRLVEAALEVARAVQRHGNHEVGPGRAERMPLARDQHAEQAPAGRLAVELEREHAMIDRVVVAIRRDERGPARRALGLAQRGWRDIRRQSAVTLRAQVEGAAGGIEAPGGTAQRAGGRQTQAFDTVQVAGDCRLERLVEVDSLGDPREHVASLAASRRRVCPDFLPL